MKKLFSFVTAMLLLGGFLLPLATIAGDGSVVDQSYEVLKMNGNHTIGMSGSGQTFRPTYNRLTAVNVYLANRQSDSLTMTIKNATTNAVVGSETHTLTFAGTAAWETFGFTPNLVVVPEGRYRMELTSNVDSTILWLNSSEAPVYERGFATKAGVTQSYDMLFSTLGKNVTTAGTVETGTTNYLAESEAKATVDESIKEPVVTHVMKNTTKISAPFEKDVAVGKNNKVTAHGTSFKGAKVLLFMDGKSYPATVDSAGVWSAELPLTGLEDKAYPVTAQAQNSTAKGSKVVEAFNLKLIAPIKTQATVAEEDWWSKCDSSFFIVGAGILLLFLLLLGLIARRHSMEGTKKESETKTVSEKDDKKTKESKEK